jgi:prepilin-type processing-associated H-X9-DG protein
MKVSGKLGERFCGGCSKRSETRGARHQDRRRYAKANGFITSSELANILYLDGRG